MTNEEKMHPYECSCYDCTNHADPESDKDPGYYIGSTLIAKRYATSYVLPDDSSAVFKKYAPGETVGVIDSYIVKGQLVWWMLKGGGYVLQLEGYFDPVTAQATASGKTFNDNQKEASTVSLNPAPIIKASVTGIADTILSIPGIKYILIGVVVVVVGMVFLSLKK